VRILLNGQPRQVADRTTVAQLIADLKLDDRPLAVELNLELVPRANHGGHQLAEGDRLEIVTLVGGG